jgi:hypothetical protein
MRDSVSLGLFSGLMGNLVKSLYNQITWRSGKNEVLYPHIASSMFFKPFYTRMHKPFLVGCLADLITGALLGMPLIYLFKKTGKDNYLMKGVGYGSFLWLVLYGAGHNLNLFTIKVKGAPSYLWAFLAHIIYGVTTAYTAVKFADPGTFPDDQLEDYNY